MDLANQLVVTMTRHSTIETSPLMKQIGHAFLSDPRTSSAAFPRFEPDETIFWDMRIYWREREGDPERVGGVAVE